MNGRAAALIGGRAEATLLTAPAYFKVEEQGFKTLANLADHPEIFASTAYLMKKSVVAADPKLPEKLIQAQAEAIKRFYEDKAFAVKTFLKYDKMAQAGRGGARLRSVRQAASVRASPVCAGRRRSNPCWTSSPIRRLRRE